MGVKCDGACSRHVGDVVTVNVYDPTNGIDWGKFRYCETAIADDKKEGFVVTIIKEATND